jgi:hypothetical protein
MRYIILLATGSDNASRWNVSDGKDDTAIVAVTVNSR